MQLPKESVPLYPGAIGENLAVAGIHVQGLTPDAHELVPCLSLLLK